MPDMPKRYGEDREVIGRSRMGDQIKAGRSDFEE